MVAPLVAAAAQTGGRVVAKKVVQRQVIQRTGTAQAQAIKNARAVKNQNLARRGSNNIPGDPLPSPVLQTPNSVGKAPTTIPQSPRSGSGPLLNTRTPNSSQGISKGPAVRQGSIRGPLLRSALQQSRTGVKKNEQINEEEQEAGTGSALEEAEAQRKQEEEMLQQARERVDRIRQKTRVYGLAGMEEGFKNKIAGLKESRAKIIQYAPALPFAILKDVLDIPGIASLPGVGTVIGIACSFAIFMILFFGRVNKKLVDSRFLLRMAISMICTTLIEFLPGINFLPVQTFTVLAIYVMDKHLTDKQIEKIVEVTHAIALRK